MDKTMKPTVNETNSNLNRADVSKKSGLKDKLGEAVERIGDKISEAGAGNLGRKIHDVGDRLEETHQDKRTTRDDV